LKADVTFEYMLDLCVDKTTYDVFDIALPSNFVLTSVEIDGKSSSLSHFCSCRIYLDGESVYDGPLGRDGFKMQIESLIPSYSLRITTDCGGLSEWVSDVEPCELRVHGYFCVKGEPKFNTAFAEVWE